MSSPRCLIDLGSKRNPRSPAFRIALLRSEFVRTSIEGYLTHQGVELDRDSPPGWFQWLDEKHTVFQARCAEPPKGDEPDDGNQPFNYFILVKLSRSFSGKLNATAIDFYHESTLLSQSKLADDQPE